jgi:hypothetical protein
LLGKTQSALDPDHDGKVNRGSTSSIFPAQSSVRNIYDLQSVGPGMLKKNPGPRNSLILDATAPSTATLRSTEPPNQDNETFSEHDFSDVESLRSLFWWSDLGAGAESLEVGELISPLSPRNTQPPSFDDGLAPRNGDTCIAQPDSRFDGQESSRDSQHSQGVTSGPDLATYYLNLSPSPELRASDFVIADDHITGHQSDVIFPLRADDPTDFGESAAIWEIDNQYTSLNDDETRIDANGRTNIGQCINRPASDFGPRTGISSPTLTESSGFGSPHYSNDHDSPVENAHGSIRDSETCPIAPAGETCLTDLDNTITTPRQPLVDKEREGNVPYIAAVVPESTRVSPITRNGACPETGAQGHASAEQPLGEAPFTSDKPTPARSHSSRTSPYPSSRKTFAKFSHVEIPSRPRAEVSRPSIASTSPNRRDWSCHPSLTNGPWRLDGTTLSIDLRDAEQVPIFIGYSSFRVHDGKLTQSLTFLQGPANGPPVNNSVRKAEPSCACSWTPLT